MPAGDAQRVWFPEMLEELKASWSKTMSWDELADFCARMSERRKQIRRERGIQPTMMWCPKCEKRTRSSVLNVSIRSALFALKKDGLLDEADFTQLDKSWMRHKKKHRLDAYGRKVETLPDEGTSITVRGCH